MTYALPRHPLPLSWEIYERILYQVATIAEWYDKLDKQKMKEIYWEGYLSNNTVIFYDGY